MPLSSGADQYIGRSQELAELTSTLDTVDSGSGSIVIVSGEPGIGKTRLLEEFAGIASSRGIVVVNGSCFEGDSTPPYWPWVQVLRLILANSTSNITAALETHSQALAELIPEVLPEGSRGASTVQHESSQARFNLFDSVHKFLGQIARTQPIVLILDDLHWADQATLDLLEFLSRSIDTIPIMIVGSYRDDELSRRHPLSASLATLARNRRFRRLLISGLDEQEVNELVESVGQVTPSSQLLTEIHQRTHGNPFFISEIARDLSHLETNVDGHVDIDDFRIPEGVREAVGIRLNRLPEECNQILRTASVIGREFGFDLLVRLNPNISTENMVNALEIAENASVITGNRGATGRYQFAHTLIQQTLNEELATVRRLQIHAQIVEAIEALYGDHIREHYSELLHHSTESQTVVGSNKVVSYALLVGEQALGSYAWSEAKSSFQKALDSQGASTDERTRSRILFGLGKSELQTLTYPEIQKGWNKVSEAFFILDELGDAESAVSVAVQSRGFTPFWLHSTKAVFERALELSPENSVESGQLLRLFSAAVRYEDEDSTTSSNALQKALDIAKSSGDTQLETGMLTELSMTAMVDGDFERATELAGRAIALASDNDYPFDEIYAHFISSTSFEALGRSDEARRHAEAEQQIELRVGSVLGGAWNEFHVAYPEGASRDIARLGEIIDSQYATDHVVRLFTGIGAWNIGKDVGIDQRISLAQQAGRSSVLQMQKASHAAFLALAARLTNNIEQAAVAAELAHSVTQTPNLTPQVKANSRVAAGLAASVLKDASIAKEMYDQLASSRRAFATVGFPFGAEHLLGLLADTTGKKEKATEHFDDAISFAQGKYDLELSWTYHDYAKSLIGFGDPTDAAKIATLIEQGLEVARRNGLTAVEKQLNQLAETVSRRSLKQQNPANLTNREIEVLRLVASGRTNQQIADDLVIAVTTAAKHVANILAKTESANRTEAATFANQNGISSA
ncbi:MAG: DUF2791 family P-loop domain-containing protein [Chloroflexi bacterium]|nr:DUF2791 family P-loop domain-containing protein [Chloroflexota bacterium]